MTRKISALTARTQLGQIMNRAVEHNDRFLVERNGEPAVLILSVTDFVKTLSPPPDWLEKSWDSAKRLGLDKLTMKDIDVEIAASRRERRTRKAKSESGQ
jgi:prevent-host-death family protein